MNVITYPARPINRGPFGLVGKKPPYLRSPKFNGWRAVIHAPTGTMFNRHGEELTITNEFTEALKNLSRSPIEWLACEALERRHDIGRGSLIVLDAIAPRLTAGERYQLLVKEAEQFQWPIFGIEQRPEPNKVYVASRWR